MKAVADGVLGAEQMQRLSTQVKVVAEPKYLRQTMVGWIGTCCWWVNL